MSIRFICRLPWRRSAGSHSRVLPLGPDSNPTTFRGRINAFVGGAAAPNWPIQTWGSQFPNAGITVPGANNVFVNPQNYTDPSRTAPLSTKYVASMVAQWDNCLKGMSVNCDANLFYKAINTAFVKNYDYYIAHCKMVPPQLQRPLNKNQLLAKVYGWVPFNESYPVAGQCPPPQLSMELPCPITPPPGSNCVVGNSPVPGQYIQLQDNWQDNQNNTAAIFNFYAQLIHDKNYLDSNSAYAYSIDDGAAFYSDPGSGLAFAIGGSANLPNPNKRPPNSTNLNSISMTLGDPALNPIRWQSYGICNTMTDTDFINPPNQSFPNNYAQQFWVNTKTWSGPPSGKSCQVTLQDTSGNIDTITITILKNIPWNANEIKNPSNILMCSGPVANFCNFVKPSISGKGKDTLYSVIVPRPCAC
jgi:hypothetical protein